MEFFTANHRSANFGETFQNTKLLPIYIINTIKQEKIQQQEKPIHQEINTLSNERLTPTKIKHPNRIAAGKRLAELNKKKNEHLKIKAAVTPRVNSQLDAPTGRIWRCEHALQRPRSRRSGVRWLLHL